MFSGGVVTLLTTDEEATVAKADCWMLDPVCATLLFCAIAPANVIKQSLPWDNPVRLLSTIILPALNSSRVELACYQLFPNDSVI